MFKVKNTHNKVFLVYDIKEQNNIIYFLVYEDAVWGYQEANRFTPIVSLHS